MKKKSRKRRNQGSFWGMLSFILTIMALYDQLRLPKEERTWQGTILGFVPYDFRLPTPERIREKFWNKDTEDILTPHLFGVGWSINLYPLLHPVLDSMQHHQEA